MKNQELFDKTVGILVKAYQNGTLIYSDCSCCAVGNIVAANNGVTLKKVTKLDIDTYGGDCSAWSLAIKYMGEGVLDYPISHEALKQIASTGYTPQQIADIERAFYLGCIKDSKNAGNNFEGLMSVCDCLMSIHSTNTQEITQAKSLFKKELAEVG